jgi:mitochondrial distribution and morphology protein 34
MAFKFTWPTFSPSFYETASNLLTRALAKAPIPPIITDAILVKELNFGTTAPELEMLEIGELGEDRFRGVFKLRYSGDAFIVLQTKVQVPPTTPFLRTGLTTGESIKYAKSAYSRVYLARDPSR